MAFISSTAYDQALAWIITNGTRVDITSSEATTYTQATSTFTLGNKTSVTIGSAGAGSPNGRQVAVPSITGGSVTGSGTAAYWAITDAASVLVATGGLSSSQGVTSGNTFSLASFTIRIAAAT